jgi:hypothetical protein
MIKFTDMDFFVPSLLQLKEAKQVLGLQMNSKFTHRDFLTLMNALQPNLIILPSQYKQFPMDSYNVMWADTGKKIEIPVAESFVPIRITKTVILFFHLVFLF